MNDPDLLMMSSFLLEYPFADRLYPGALDVLRHVGQWGGSVILSDGDAVFQPRKVQRSGLWDAVEGRVLIYIHKERSEEHTSELQSLMRISYAVFCLKKKKKRICTINDIKTVYTYS